MIIKANNISMIYKDKKKEIKALDNVSFEIKKGSITGLIGFNGAGKSTLTKIICGILTPSEGKVEILGKDSTKLKNNDFLDISVLFGQRNALWWDLNVEDSFKLTKVMYHISDYDYKTMLKYLNDNLHLENIMNKAARTLSLGQKALANIALALIMKPKVVLFDEPTLGLDFFTRKVIREFIIKYNHDFNTTFIITSHDIDDIELLSDYILLLDKGKLVYQGSLELLKQNYSNDKLYIISGNNIDSIINELKVEIISKNNNSFICSEEELIKIEQSLLTLLKEGSITKIDHYHSQLENILESIYHEHH